MNKKLIFIGIAIIAIIVFVVFIVKDRDITGTKIENGIATNDVKIDEVTFSNITKTYEEGITTLSAKMTNNSSETKNFTVKITMKDDKGKVIQSLTQVVENLEKGKSKILSIGVLGDFRNTNDIKFEV